ncbi:helix-hairpin-helix domain-containing protein [Metabacillus sp. GX 13764]|uniref:helix-hairpin-helix domain-containing protein n=1 Tax=Metabacillus kandeliae TaxID=2900151 RepID=UPI001E5FDB2A|nr:helix-hairpin-helix domain-containing protein [Metabacillus kandeliae]MCD7033029.1 helix-hairpin-helix domain-containing protein [Metabacillus kandeliae]
MENLIKYKWHLIAVGAVLAAFLFFQYGLPGKEEKKEPAAAEESFEFASTEHKSPKPPESASMNVVIDIKGSVKAPGVYSLKKGSRVNDAVRKAGGMTIAADKKAVNLASVLQDGTVIYVPEKGEEGAALPQSGNSGTTPAGSGETLVNLNSADEEQLQTLTGIGPSKAAAIIGYREEKGSFQKIEDLKEVTGIGEKTFEKLKEEITVN